MSGMYWDAAKIARDALARNNRGKTVSFKQNWPARAFTIHDSEAAPSVIHVKGRDRWALENLLRAGSAGCTPLNHPGPRWSAYVHKLRRAGVSVETIHEMHDGPFPGRHARYVLRSRISTEVAP